MMYKDPNAAYGNYRDTREVLMEDDKKSQPGTPKLSTASEVADALSCAKSSVYALARAGRIPYYRLGETGIRFDLEAVLEALKQ